MWNMGHKGRIFALAVSLILLVIWGVFRDFSPINSTNVAVVLHSSNLEKHKMTRNCTVSLNKISCEKSKVGRSGNGTLDCRRRLPQAICIGAKKCGTAALFFFLNRHPALVSDNTRELQFWSHHPDNSLDWYLSKMPVSSQYQVTMERSTGYFVSGVGAKIIQGLQHPVKFLLILRDPVKRAISDYVHMMASFPHLLHADPQDPNIEIPRYANPSGVYTFTDTFEESILTEAGEVNIGSAYIHMSIYVLHLRKWLNEVPAEDIFIVDGEEFVRDPFPQVKAIESFLGLPEFFNRRHFSFHETKGFHCLATSRGHNCLVGDTKGRSHPNVSTSVLHKMEEFYRPYNRELEELVGRTFSWSS